MKNTNEMSNGDATWFRTRASANLQRPVVHKPLRELSMVGYARDSPYGKNTLAIGREHVSRCSMGQSQFWSFILRDAWKHGFLIHKMPGFGWFWDIPNLATFHVAPFDGPFSQAGTKDGRRSGSPSQLHPGVRGPLSNCSENDSETLFGGSFFDSSHIV